jgi:hypothetical protein
MAWQFLVQLGLYAAATGVQYHEERKARQRRIASGEREAVPAPYVTEDAPIPVVFGTAEVANANVIYRGRQRFIDEEWGLFADSDEQHWRYEDWYYAICQGPVTSWQSRYGDFALTTTPLATGSTEYSLTPAGQDGNRYYHQLRVYPGSLTQTSAGLLLYRHQGLCYAAVSAHAVGGSGDARPDLQPMSFTVTRRDERNISTGINTWVQGVQWQSTSAAIGDDMNPAHIIREVLTDPVWGMSLDDTAIDDVSFLAAANTLVAEGFGLSFIWSGQSSAAEFIQDVLRHIDGLLYVEPATSKFTLRLLRQGSNTLHDLTDPGIIIGPPTYTRPGYRELPNKVTVTYSSRALSRERMAQAGNSARISQFGEIISTFAYPGIHSDAVAAMVAGRDLQRLSSPLARVSISTTWTAGQGIRPGDRVSWAWSPYGIASMNLRVLGVEYGSLSEAVVTLDCIEDVYAGTLPIFGAPGVSAWVPPSDAALDAINPVAFQLPLAWSQTLDTTLDATSTGYVPCLAVESPSSIHIGWDLLVSSTRVPPPRRAFSPTRTLAANATVSNGATEQVLSLSSMWTEIEAGPTYIFLVGNELMRGRIASGQFRVFRGCWDTVPAYISPTVSLAAGTRIWLLGQVSSDERYALGFGYSRMATDVASVPLASLSRTSTQIQSPTSITTTILSAIAGGNRAIRPYPMGFLSFSFGVSGGFTTSWRRRNRLTAPNTTQAAADRTPETGTTHRIRVEGFFGGAWIIVASQATLGYAEVSSATTTYTYSAAQEELDFKSAGGVSGPFENLRFFAYTARDGYESWQRHERRRSA